MVVCTIGQLTAHEIDATYHLLTLFSIASALIFDTQFGADLVRQRTV